MACLRGDTCKVCNDFRVAVFQTMSINRRSCLQMSSSGMKHSGFARTLFACWGLPCMVIVSCRVVSCRVLCTVDQACVESSLHMQPT